MTALPTDPRRLLVAGDTHGNGNWVVALIELARRHGCDAILQLGDFGYWAHRPDGRAFLGRVNEYLRLRDQWLFWIDGNHENHDLLAEQERDASGMVPIRERILYLPRGHRWSWCGVSFGALGGAASVDWRMRSPGLSWWPNEVVTDENVELLGHEPLDVLLTHDAPHGVTIESWMRVDPVTEAWARESRVRLARAVENTSPRLVLHGHWHRRVSNELARIEREAIEAQGVVVWTTTQVEGFASDIEGGTGSWAVLDLPGLVLSQPEADGQSVARP